jgi:hypothetical protein
MSAKAKGEQDDGVASGPEDPIYENHSRTRREGAFVSPFGTEGAQWEGFPEYDEEDPPGERS